MPINYDKILGIYGQDMLISILENLKDVESNVNYLNSLGYSDTIDIFERYPYIFIQTENEFKSKINELKNKIGDNHVEIIENNLELLEEL